MPPLPTVGLEERLWWHDKPGLETVVITIAEQGYRFDLTYGVSVASFKLQPEDPRLQRVVGQRPPLYRVDNFLWWEETE